MKESPELHELPALAPEPVRHIACYHSRLTEIDSHQGADTGDKAERKQRVDQELLAFRHFRNPGQEKYGVTDPAHEKPEYLQQGMVTPSNIEGDQFI